MASADSCTFSTVLQRWLLLSEPIVQISPGTTRFFSSIYLPHLSHMIPCSYWALACVAVLPSCVTSYAIPVRQARGLPAGLVLSPTSSFLQIPPHGGHPCLRLYPSHYRADSGLSPVRNVYPLILYTACRSLTLRQSSRFFSCAFPLPALQFRRVRCQFLPHAVPYRTYLPSGDSCALPALPVHSSPISPLPVSLFRSPSVSSHQGHSAFLSPKRMSVSSSVSTDYSKVPVSVSVPAYSTNSRSCLPKRLHSGFCLPNCYYLQKHWRTCWHSRLQKCLCLSSLMHSGLH